MIGPKKLVKIPVLLYDGYAPAFDGLPNPVALCIRYVSRAGKTGEPGVPRPVDEYQMRGDS